MEAAKLGIDGIELQAVGDFSPKTLTQTARREVMHLFRSHNLVPTALYCPLRRGLDVVEDLEPRLDALREAMTLAFELGPRLIIVPIGQIPENAEDPVRNVVKEALTALGQFGDRMGCMVAIDTGLDSAETLSSFLNTIDSGSLKVCYSPGNLLANRLDPYASLRTLASRVAYVHANDARMVSPTKRTNVPLGHGDLDWLQLIATFEEIEYRGFATLADANGLDEATRGIKFLNRLLGRGAE